MSDAVLEAMPDLLGHCNMKPCHQTMHYTFVEKLTLSDFGGCADAYAPSRGMPGLVTVIAHHGDGGVMRGCPHRHLSRHSNRESKTRYMLKSRSHQQF